MTSLNELSIIHNKISAYKGCEELFGILHSNDKKENLKQIKEIYTQLLAVCHPDKNSDSKDKEKLSNTITVLLSVFYKEAKEKIENNIYSNIRNVIATTNGELIIERKIAEGDFANIYFTGSAVKVIREESNNDLIANEIEILTNLKHKSLPNLIDTFTTNDNKLGWSYDYIDGLDLVELRQKYPNGIPENHVCWITERLLSVVGFLHTNLIIHGNIEPSNILVRPNDHNVFLIDLVFAVRGLKKPFKGFTENYSAPEVSKKENATPAADIYSLGKCLIYALGGNIETNSLPTEINPDIVDFILQLIKARPKDAWELWGKLSDLRETIYGNRHQFDALVI